MAGTIQETGNYVSIKETAEKKYLFIIQANPKNFITNREMYKVELKNKLKTGSS